MTHTEIKVCRDFWHRYIYCWICFNFKCHDTTFCIKCSVYIIKIIFDHFLLDFHMLSFILIDKELSLLNYVIFNTFLIESFIIFIFKKISLKICLKCHDCVIVFCTFCNYVKLVICHVVNNQHLFNKIVNTF